MQKSDGRYRPSCVTVAGRASITVVRASPVKRINIPAGVRSRHEGVHGPYLDARCPRRTGRGNSLKGNTGVLSRPIVTSTVFDERLRQRSHPEGPAGATARAPTRPQRLSATATQNALTCRGVRGVACRSIRARPRTRSTSKTSRSGCRCSRPRWSPPGGIERGGSWSPHRCCRCSCWSASASPWTSISARWPIRLLLGRPWLWCRPLPPRCHHRSAARCVPALRRSTFVMVGGPGPWFVGPGRGQRVDRPRWSARVLDQDGSGTVWARPEREGRYYMASATICGPAADRFHRPRRRG